MKQLRFFDQQHRTKAACAKVQLAAAEGLEQKYASLVREDPALANAVSYVANRRVPFLRLFRYKEAFAFKFVEEFISRLGLNERDYLMDPFCGMGTTLFTASRRGIACVGVDRIPVGVFVARTLPLFYSLQPGQISQTYDRLKATVDRARPARVASDVAIMKVAFPPATALR